MTPADGYQANSPEVLNATEAFIAKAEALDSVRSGFSLAMIYRRMSEVLGAIPEMMAEPISSGMAAQLAIGVGFSALRMGRERA